MKYLIPILLLTLLASCSPSKRLDRLLRKNPELKVVDSVEYIVHDTIQAIDLQARFSTDTSTTSLDTVLLTLREYITNDSIIEVIRYMYKYKQVLKDTSTRIIDGVTIKMWQEGQYIGLNLTKPEEITQEIAKVPCPELVYQRGWWDKVWITLGQFSLFLYAIFILVIRGLIRKK